MDDLPDKNTCKHIVQFYANEDHLLDSVSAFIGSGLLTGDLAILIATEPHLAALRQRLKKEVGESAASMLHDQRHCLFLDADKVLPSILIDGWPDQQRFNEVIGHLINSFSAGADRHVRAFGEMVALLCEQGKHDAAIRVEELWNGLAKHYSFTLLCGYPLSVFPADQHTRAINDICHLHSRVCPAEAEYGECVTEEGHLTLVRLQHQTYALKAEAERRKRAEEALRDHERLLIQRTDALTQANVQLKDEVEKRKRSEKELLHTQYVLTHAQSVAHLGSWEIDATTAELTCSDEFYRICGLEPQSRKLDLEFSLSIVHPDDQQATRAAVAATRKHGLPYNIEKRIIRPDGSVRYVLSKGHPVYNEKQELVTMIGSFMDITERKLAERALQQSHDDLRRLTAHQQKLKEEERKRIAREIHDELGGVLTGLKAYLTVAIQNAEDAGMAPDKLLIEASHFIDGAVESVRRIISDLRPSVLDQLGVWAAIEWYADRIATQTGLSCQCMITRTAADIELDTERSTMLFRIVQEALTNVIRHANASEVRIGVGYQDNCIIIEVEDDGKGIDTDNFPQRESWGIRGMYERVRYFGGEFVITGMPGQGTILMLKLPLQSPHVC
ncbi:MEDS domain-containing protein [Noviherbaspirillum saxi]|nr:MEDS domain-containing protein [Noviherbaspirillum saxi]